jgi:type 1 fimbria pilin
MMMRRLTGLLYLMLALCLPATAWAACTGTPASFNVNIQPNVPVFNPSVTDGTVLWSSPLLNASVSSSALTCTGGFGTVALTGVGTYNSAYKTYSTNIPGIGLRIRDINGSYFPLTSTTWSTSNLIASMNVPFYIDVIKTGPVTSSGAVSGNILQYAAQNGAYPLFFVYISTPIVINPTIPTCTVTTPSITVSMGNVARNSFTGVGSTSPAQPLNIGLNCSGGATGVVATVYTTLTDQTSPSNVSSTLSLTSASTAKGVGIQVLNGTNIVSYGADSKTIGNKNQWVAGQTGNGTFNIPLTARYVQTATTINAGTANGIATFTISYQ